MGWKQISECLPAELTAKMDKLEKGPEAVTPPASQQGGNVKHRKNSRGLPDMSREIAVATPAPRRASPNAAAAISLVIDNTGGRQDGGGNRPVGLTRTAGRGQRRDLVLVHCAASSS